MIGEEGVRAGVKEVTEGKPHSNSVIGNGSCCVLQADVPTLQTTNIWPPPDTILPYFYNLLQKGLAGDAAAYIHKDYTRIADEVLTAQKPLKLGIQQTQSIKPKEPKVPQPPPSVMPPQTVFTQAQPAVPPQLLLHFTDEGEKDKRKLIEEELAEIIGIMGESIPLARKVDKDRAKQLIDSYNTKMARIFDLLASNLADEDLLT